MHKIKVLVVCVFVLSVFHILTLQAFGQENELVLEELDKYNKQAMEDWKIPGMAISIVHNDSVIFAKGYGKRSVNKKGKVNEHTLFAIASLTKAFTSAALSKLVDEGIIKWDDKVIKVMPYFKVKDPYRTSEITIRDLLCHRVGYKTFSGDLLWYGTIYNRKQIIDKLQYLDFEYGFRSHFGYSNLMYLVAGEIIPEVTDRSWDIYVRQEFFNPLGMTRTNTSLEKLENDNNVAIPHTESEGKLITIPFMKWHNAASAAAINSTAYDMAKWIKLQLNEGKLHDEQIISEEQQYEMWSAHTIEKIQPGSARFWPSTHFKSYGLGWEMFDYQGRKILCHSGGTDGMISHLFLVPEEELGMVVLTNSINFLPTALMYQVLDMYFGIDDSDWSGLYLQLKNMVKNEKEKRKLEEEQKRVKNTQPTIASENFAGIYGGKMYGNAKVEYTNNNLIIRFLPTPNFIGELTHWHYNTFKIKLRDTPQLPEGMVHFSIDRNGDPSRMIIDIPNPDFDFTELKFERISN